MKFRRKPHNWDGNASSYRSPVVIPRSLHRESINLYSGNDAASNAMIRGDCADDAPSSMIQTFWKMGEELGLDVRIGRVVPEVDPADLPTSKPEIHSPIRERVQLRGLFKMLRTSIGNYAD